MLTRRGGYLQSGNDAAPAAAAQLQRDGYVMLPGAVTDGIDRIRAGVDRLFAEPPDPERGRGSDEFRYETLNRCAEVQELVTSRVILDVVEPLLGEDCHVIANTTWRNPAGREVTHGGGRWHMDAGPHVPRPVDVPWDHRIPYPVFALAVHVLLAPMPIESGPTGVIPGSHTSGQAPPSDRLDDVDLTWNGTPVLPLVGDTGDVVMFVSDIWHRRLPTLPGDPGRYFVQVHYGRRDIAQRLRPTASCNHLSDEAMARAGTDRRARSVIGLHDPFFYDG